MHRYPHGWDGPRPLAYRVEGQRQHRRSQPIVNCLLVLPHLVLLVFLQALQWAASLVAAVSVLFAARYPLRLFEFALGVTRWRGRVASYINLQTESYPPFSTAEDASYPATLTLQYPDRGRIPRQQPLLGWLLVLPQLLFLPVIYLSTFLMVLVAAFSIVFTKRFPPNIFNFVTDALAFSFRVRAYAFFMTDAYPGFSFS